MTAAERVASALTRVERALTADRVAFSVASIGLVAAALLSWLVTPLQSGIRGYSFPLLGHVLLADGRLRPLRLFSFGIAALLLAIVVGLAAWRQWRRAGFWLGAAAVLLSLYFVGLVTLWRSEILEAAVAQNLERLNIKVFDRIAIGGVASLMYVNDLGTGTLYDRIWSSLWLYGFGWQLAISSGLFLQCWVLVRERRLGWHVVAFGGVVLLLLVGLGGRAVVAEFYALQGDAFDARGDFTAAQEAYERALGWNRALDYNPSLQHRLGEVYAQLGILDEPQTYIYRGNLYLARNEFLQARQAYGQALAIRKDQPVALRGRVDTYVQAGLDHYRDEEFHKAIGEWEPALELDPAQVQVPFFLGRTNFAVRRDRTAILANEMALERTGDQLVRADLFIVLGDAYYRLGEFVRAREMYSSSLNQYQSVTYLLNWTARKRLQGI